MKPGTATVQHVIRRLTLALVLTGFLFGQAPITRADTPADTPTGDLPEGTLENAIVPDLAPDAIAVTDPDAIRQALEDLTIYGRYFDGEDWIEYHVKDGRTAYNEKGCTYPGKWWIENGTICYAYPNYRDNAPNCFVMFIRPNGGIQFVAFAADGSAYLASSSIKTAPGNDAHLPLGGMSPCVGV